MSSSSCRCSSISKQRGAEMSSRLMPPNAGAISLTVAHDLVGVVRVQADRERVDAGELLEQAALALHHRHRRTRSDVAEAEHRGAVGHDGDGVALDRVLERALSGRRRSPGRRARRPACRPSRGRRACSAGACCAARSCRRRAAGTCGRWCRSPRRPRARRSRDDRIPVLAGRRRRRRCRAGCGRRPPRPGRPRRRRRPASPIALVTWPRMPCGRRSLTRIVRRNCALGVALTGGLLLVAWRPGC